MFYTVIEIQKQDSGDYAVVPVVYETEDEAYSKFYQILVYASQRTIPYHGAYILRSDGVMIEGKHFTKEAVYNEI